MSRDLRACSKSSEQKRQECEMDELQARVELALAVLPQAPILLQPSEAALDDPTFGHDLEGMQFAALGNLDGSVFAQNVSYPLGERLAGVAAVAYLTMLNAMQRDNLPWNPKGSSA